MKPQATFMMGSGVIGEGWLIPRPYHLERRLLSRGAVQVLPWAWLSAPVALGIIGCGPVGSAPLLETSRDATAFPGAQLHLELRAEDENPGALRFEYDSLVPLDGIYQRSEILAYDDGEAAFQYRPVANDVGQHPFRFRVTDEDGLSDDTIVWISVRPGGASAPIFREPVGAGLTLDSLGGCVDLDVVVEDSDTPEVTLSQEPPLLSDALLTRLNGHAARWSWCPPVEASGSYPLWLAADDGENDMTFKSFLILVR